MVLSKSKSKFPLIGICGLEGASKSTSIQTVKDTFESTGLALFATREPGGTPLAESIRNIHKQVSVEEVSPLTELLLMFASREQSYAHVIIPELQKRTVITDRLWACSYAYQVAALPDRSPKKRILTNLFDRLLESIFATAEHQAILWLDVDPEVGMKRARSRGELDRIEQRDIDFFHRVRQGYWDLTTRFPDLFYRVDANGSMDDVQAGVRSWAEYLIKDKLASYY